MSPLRFNHLLPQGWYVSCPWTVTTHFTVTNLTVATLMRRILIMMNLQTRDSPLCFPHMPRDMTSYHVTWRHTTWRDVTNASFEILITSDVIAAREETQIDFIGRVFGVLCVGNVGIGEVCLELIAVIFEKEMQEMSTSIWRHHSQTEVIAPRCVRNLPKTEMCLCDILRTYSRDFAVTTPDLLVSMWPLDNMVMWFLSELRNTWCDFTYILRYVTYVLLNSRFECVKTVPAIYKQLW